MDKVDKFIENKIKLEKELKELKKKKHYKNMMKLNEMIEEALNKGEVDFRVSDASLILVAKKYFHELDTWGKNKDFYFTQCTLKKFDKALEKAKEDIKK